MRKKLLAAAISLLGSFIAAEGLVRLLNLAQPLALEVTPYGYRQRPGAYYFNTGEGNSSGHYNRFGLRDRDIYELRKPPKTYRILIFGDSYTEAPHVDVGSTYENLLEDRLNKIALSERYDRFEVLNFGLVGAGTGEQLLRFKHQGAPFQPDLVVLAFFAGNDYEENALVCSGVNNRPYFRQGAQGLELDNSFYAGRRGRLRAMLWFLRQKSALFDGLYRQTKLVLNRGFWAQREVKQSSAPNASFSDLFVDGLKQSRYHQSQLLLKDYPPYLQECTQITFALLKEFQREAAAAGSQFLVVIIPIDYQVQTDMIKPEVFAEYPLERDKPVRLVADFLRREGMAHFSLLAMLRRSYEKDKKNSYGFSGSLRGHMNQWGHRLFSGALENHLCRNYLNCSP